ncbi:MAG: 30S ribosomal protein S12 methylthiotransferase RimO [Lachnospiraceae bacterium]|nr:30S ribosomal protein S12 methylthiotransferase RimO [Lachnospiraceae bacterium]
MKILFVSLGCDKNLVDTEKMLALVQEQGYEITNEEEEAEVVVVNTCCFIQDAKEESIVTILEYAKKKEEGFLKGIIITGCLAQRYKEEIQKEIPEVDVILGSASYDSILEALENLKKNDKKNKYDSLEYLPKNLTKRVITTGTSMAYLKIAEGCNKRCTYCIIPSIRGNYRSVPMEEVLDEAGQLAKKGIKELVLVAQEVTLYGKDIYQKKALPKLLEELCKIEGIEWIRLLYCYPEEITDELIEVMKTEEKICHYIDMPIQHSEDTILKRMGRRTTKAQIKEVIGKLREAMPDICIRTTLITGFPGETQEEHEALMEFVDEMEFDRLGVFTYSKEEDTKAAEFENQVEEEIKEQRKEEIMQLQQEVSYDLNQDMIGKELEVLIEGYLFDEDVYVGRSYKDAPTVDGYVFVSSEEEIVSGSFVKVKIKEAEEYDLIGDVIYEFTE